jgi:hypothetical protein
MVNKTKLNHIKIPAIVFLVIVATALAVRLWPRTVPFEQCSDLYQKYAAVEGIDAKFIKDYKVNDTIFIDVTLLEAKSDSAWLTLQTDFHIPIIPEEYRELFENTDAIDYWLAPKGKYIPPMDSVLLNNDAVTVSRKKHLVSVFHLTNETQADVIFLKKLHEINKDNE